MSIVASPEDLPRNKLSLLDKVQMFLTLLPARKLNLPPMSSIVKNSLFYPAAFITWALLKSPFTSYGRARSWKRIVIDRASFLVMTGMNRRQTRAFFGPTRKAYDDFIKSKNWEPVVEELGEDARLLWIGPKQTDRVLLYFHGNCINYGLFEIHMEYSNSHLNRRRSCFWDSCVFSSLLELYAGKSGEERKAHWRRHFKLL